MSYRVKYFLEQTIRAALEALQAYESEILVVDNNSGDDTMAFVKQRFAQGEVTFIENAENVGFARANNQAIARARGRYTLILNPDTIVTAQAIGQCVQWMRSHDQCGAIGVRMIDGDGHFLPESKRAFPTPWVAFCKIFGLSLLFPRSPRFAKYHLRYLDERQPHSVDILAGAYMFCRTALLQRLKGFDRDFFMYGEDIDLSYRMVEAGYQNWYLPVSIVHYKGESTHKDSLHYVRVFYEAMLIFYRKHFPRYRALAYPVVKAGVLVRQSFAVAKRVAKRLLGLGRRKRPRLNAPWTILAADAAGVAARCGIAQWSSQLPQRGPGQVLIDDGSHTYGQIVDLIARNSRRGLHFHIFSSRNGIVISPKMDK